MRGVPAVLKNLTPDEAAVVDAATDRLVPGPQGARDAGVVAYVDELLTTFPDLVSRYREGIAALGAFATRSGDEQDAALVADASGFRDLLFEHAVEGWLSSPVGWAAVGFRGPGGHPDADVSASDGPDPIERTPVVEALLQLVRPVFGAE